jgi:Terminase large subunit, T4likevirus-type, N-terminal/Terminase RNaseH-like domain
MEIEDIKKEYLKCKKDPEYFISKYIKVSHPTRGLVQFQLYPFQSKILSEIQGHKSVILRKFRQAGATTICGAYALWFSMFNDHKTVAVLSKDDEASKEVVSRIKIMHEELPPWLKPGLSKNTEHLIKFENGSIIRSKASGKQAGRSISASLLIVDEAAFIEHIDTIWAAAAPTLSTGGKIICLSTVNGTGNWYHKMWTQAIAKENGFHPIQINWQDHPEYNCIPGYESLYIKDWYKVNRPKYSYKEWRQEYECMFEGTGDTYIDSELLVSLKQNCNNEYKIKYNNRMRVWKDPEDRHEYVISVDPSIGRERDYSAFHIIDLYNGEQVAEFYSNRTPLDELANIIVKEGRYYNLAYVISERNGIGNNLIYFLQTTLEYENLVMDDNRDIGIQITQKNRDYLLADMENSIRNSAVKINSERLVDELLTFVIDPDTGKIEADNNCHDDLIMSFAIGLKVFNDLASNYLIERDPLIDNKAIDRPGIYSTKYKVRTATGGITEEDYKWLIGR